MQGRDLVGAVSEVRCRDGERRRLRGGVHRAREREGGRAPYRGLPGEVVNSRIHEKFPVSDSIDREFNKTRAVDAERRNREFGAGEVLRVSLRDREQRRVQVQAGREGVRVLQRPRVQFEDLQATRGVRERHFHVHLWFFFFFFVVVFLKKKKNFPMSFFGFCSLVSETKYTIAYETARARVESARAQRRGVEQVQAVRRADHEHVGLLPQAVQFREQPVHSICRVASSFSVSRP